MHIVRAHIALQHTRVSSYILFRHRRVLNEAREMTFKQSFANWRRYRNTCNEMYRMSDRELNDIGISRGDIPFVARQSTR